ncbi:MAG: A/G-specific adenine glycosylase [Gemmatimonadota bacterium]
MNPDLDRLRADLLGFYDRQKRDLPWRREEDPYRILVSEVMLQQTRVDTVLGYYEPWLGRFPDIEALAAASEDSVLKAWEGLGYYRRARNLHAAARVVREEWGGAVPSTEAELRMLPGVGEYTAGAVASIAFGEAVPAVDGNVRRALARLYDVVKPTARWLRETAAALVDPERPGDWNQALMELGATVCTPRAPSCGACPVAWGCAARSAGTVDERPAPTRKRAPRKAVIALVVLRAPGGEVLLERRGEGGVLAGMWAFPEQEIDGVDRAAEAARELAAEFLTAGHGSPAGTGDAPLAEARPLPHVRHHFTHIHATYVPWLLEVADVPERCLDSSDRETRWAGSAERSELALPVAQRTVLAHL